MSRKKSGIESLVDTLIKQHGLETAYWMSRDQVKTLKDPRRLGCWIEVSKNLSNLREFYRIYA